jgi:hypothetical protein
MAKEKWAKAYVKANIRETEKGYHCKMPTWWRTQPEPSP